MSAGGGGEQMFCIRHRTTLHHFADRLIQPAPLASLPACRPHLCRRPAGRSRRDLTAHTLRVRRDETRAAPRRVDVDVLDSTIHDVPRQHAGSLARPFIPRVRRRRPTARKSGNDVAAVQWRRRARCEENTRHLTHG